MYSDAPLDIMKGVNHHLNDVAAVTSIRLPHMNMMQHAKGFIFNHPVLLHVWAYFDGDDGVSPPQRDNVTWVNISHVQPWAAAYIKANLSSRDASVASPTQQAYRSGVFQPCVVPVRQKNNSKAGNLCRDPQTILKVAAMFDAVMRPIARRHILWLDSDAYFQQELDDVFFRWMRHFDVATIWRNNGTSNPETGITAFTLTRETRHLLHAAQSAYYHFDKPRYHNLTGVNDVSVFKLLMIDSPDPGLRVGRFATGCRDSTRSRWEWDARLYQYKFPHSLDCASDSQNFGGSISPFNVLQYATHCKSSGPIMTMELHAHVQGC